MSEPTGARRYGTGGGDAYYDAVKYGGYEGTREQFGKDQAEFATNATAVAAAKEVVEQDTEEVRSTKETFVNTTVPDAITAIQQEGTTQVQAVTQQGEESSQQVEAVGTQWKDEVANEGRARVQAVEQAGTNQVQAVNDAGTTQVGAVNQAGADQVNAVEQAGTGQVQAVTDEGTTQITAVEDAGAAERTAIEEKGEQTRESIPDDYTALSDEVDNLNRHLSDVEENLDAVTDTVFDAIDTSGAIIYIENGVAGLPINLKKLTIEATQSGSGTPSPTNKRPFTGGYQAVNFYVSPTEDQEDATVQQFDLPAGAGTVYRCVIDFEAKKVTVKSVHKKLVGSGDEGISVYTGQRMRVSAPGFSSASSSTLMPIYSDILKTVTKAAQPATYAISQSDPGRAELIMSITGSYTTVAAVNEWLQANNVEIDYPLATQRVYSFDEIPQLAMLNGDNYVWSDAGKIDLSYFVEKIVTDIETDQCVFFEDQEYTNMYNPDDPDILINHQIQANDNISAYNGLEVSGYIPCSAGETFMFPVYTSHFGTGSTAYTITTYDANKSFLSNVTGTIANDILTITIPSGSSAKYFRVNVCTLNVNSLLIETQYHSASNFMVIKGTTFPDRFYPYVPQVLMDAEIYSGHENLSNPLYTKKAVFLGDSICEGDAKSGWAGRIGMDNTMLWCNRGIGGSTIAITSAGKTICTRSLLMSDPDYIIFEGGTNDADRIGDATGETKPAAFGTWSESNYGTNDASTYYGFDINTFCGAVDYLCKRLISNYAGAKIGFIGAHKMGTTDSTRANRGYYIHTAMEICKKWGVPVLNLWDNCYLNPKIPAHYTSGESYLYTDGQHLTANGYEYISPMIEAWMKTL